MIEPKPKPFDISKRVVYAAWLRVKANQGAAGVDGQSIDDFETDLKSNLFKAWNRMSSGSYFPPPVRAVEIPKSGGGIRVLGVPTVADRVAQTVASMYLERKVEPIFHPDSGDSRTNPDGRSARPSVPDTSTPPSERHHQQQRTRQSAHINVNELAPSIGQGER